MEFRMYNGIKKSLLQINEEGKKSKIKLIFFHLSIPNVGSIIKYNDKGNPNNINIKERHLNRIIIFYIIYFYSLDFFC